MTNPATFALDFDDTFTLRPALWKLFIESAEAIGDRVIIVTARRDTEANNELVRAALKEQGLILPIVFTSLGSKLDAVKKRGITVSVWIDDNPTSLVHGH